MNTNVDNVEEEINQEFIKQIEELPEEIKDPVENTLEYIKKRAKCNDYEAAQIQFLMSEQSAQKTGYKYFCRYIAGLSTVEEDNADYYKSIRKSWNRFLDKFATMTLDERVETLTVVSASFENVAEVLVNAGPRQLEYILKKTEKEKNKIEELSEELQSHKTSYLVMHPEYTMNKAAELTDTMEKYNKKIITSAKEQEITSADEDIYIEKLNAYDNIVKSWDALHVKNRELKIWGGINHTYKAKTVNELNNKIWTTIKAEKDSIGTGDIIQVEVKSEHKNLPMYLYAQVYQKINDPLGLNCRVMTLHPFDEKGEEIREDDPRLDRDNKIEGGTKEEDMPPEIDFLSLTGIDPSTEGGKTTQTLIKMSQITEDITDADLQNPETRNEALAKIKMRYKIFSEDKAKKTVFSDLYTVYHLDPTYLKHRVLSLGEKVDEASRKLSEALIYVGGVLMVVGALLAVLGFCFFVANVVIAVKSKPSKYERIDDNKDNTDGGASKDSKSKWTAPSVGEWIGSISMFASGLITLGTGATSHFSSISSLKKANEWKKERGERLQNIYKDIFTHNKFPQNHKN